jgi:hypothetical protein
LNTNRTISLLSASSTVIGGVKFRVSGSTLFIRNDSGTA